MITRFNSFSNVAAMAILSGLSWGAAVQSADAGARIDSIQFPTLKTAVAGVGTPTYLKINPNYSETSNAVFTFSLGARRVHLVYGGSVSAGGASPIGGAAAAPAVGGYSASQIMVVDIETSSVLTTINEPSRDYSEMVLREFLTDLYERDTAALKLQVANTPIDPVAGNPTSLQTTMASASFQSGSTVGPSARTGGARASGTLGYSHLGVSLQNGRYSGPGYSANITTLPLSYSLPFDDPRWALQLDAPLTFATVNGQSVMSGSIGVGLRMPVFDNWTLTPELRIGMTRNRALGVNATLFAASITSNYQLDLRGGFGVVFGNSLTYSKSLSTNGVNYDLENVINKNGIEVSGPVDFQLYGLPTNWQFSVVHSKIYGTPTYIDEWVDISASLGTIGSKNGVTWDSVRVGLTYTRANRGIQGINLNFGYEF